MKEGTTIAIVRDTDTAPTKSPNTLLVGASLASGGIFATANAFSDTVENLPTGPKRTCTWLMDGAIKMRFEPIPEAEELTFAEFRQRYESQAWCEENPNHPISYMRAAAEHHRRLVDKIKTLKPMMLIRKGKRIAIVPSGSDAASTATREEILAIF